MPNNHGGARPGAGRKPAEEKTVRIWVRVSPAMLQAVEQWRINHRLTQRAEAIRQMLDFAAGRSQS